jgi:hypothetical protein
MQFESANPSVVRSIRQRDLLNTWLRAAASPRPLPVLTDYRPECLADELPDMMGFDVEGCGDKARFLITQEGATLTKVYGNEHIVPKQRTNRYLDDAIGPERYEHVITLYRTCLASKRPTYSISWCRTRTARTSSMSACCCRSAAPTASSTSLAPTRPSHRGQLQDQEPDRNAAQRRTGDPRAGRH